MAHIFPVVGSGAFDTNPTYSGSFIPQLWSNKLNAKFYLNTESRCPYQKEIFEAQILKYIKAFKWPQI